MKKQNAIILATIILLAAGCTKHNQPTTIQSQPASPVLQNSTSPDYIAGQTGASQGNSQVKNITVTQTVEGSNLNQPSYQVAEGKTALDLLRLSHQVQTKTYGGVGEFVQSIDGITPDSKRFWAFYVNGKSSEVGASSYVLKNGDKIEWKLDLIN